MEWCHQTMPRTGIYLHSSKIIGPYIQLYLSVDPQVRAFLQEFILQGVEESIGSTCTSDIHWNMLIFPC